METIKKLGPDMDKYAYWMRPVLAGKVSYETMFMGPGLYIGECELLHQAMDVEAYISRLRHYKHDQKMEAERQGNEHR